jgi:hypothetical protein
MTPADILVILVLIAVLYLAFRVGAFLMKVLLGLVAIGLVVWLVAGLVGAADAAIG